MDRHAFVFDVEAEPFVEQLHGVVLEEAAVDVGAEVLVEGPLEELVSGVYGLEELVAVAEEVGSVREAGQVSAARIFLPEVLETNQRSSLPVFEIVFTNE